MKDISFKELKQKEYLTENEALVYTTLSRSAFRKWARQIGADRKIENSPKGRVVYLRSIIDQSILEGKR